MTETAVKVQEEEEVKMQTTTRLITTTMTMTSGLSFQCKVLAWADIPTEVAEKILRHLPFEDAVRSQSVSKYVYGTLITATALQSISIIMKVQGVPKNAYPTSKL